MFSMSKKIIISSFLFLFCIQLNAQTLGGSTVFNFLNQPNSSQLSALGGNNISNISNDVSLSFNNPALLRDKMHQQFDASFNNFLAGIKNYSLTSAFHANNINTNFALGVNYFDYGNIPQTDIAGNILGTFRPNDYVVQLSASHSYLQRFWYGMTFKYISSNYAQYKSNGIAFDIGVAYHDSASLFQASVLIKNLGTQLKTYDGSNQKSELPFDIEAGVTKRLEKAPVQFSLTAHHLQAFNIYYNDTAFNASEGGSLLNNVTLDKIFSHLVLSAQFFVGDKIEITSGYNFLRRHDLNAYNQANGLNGFTLGVGVLLKKLHIRYATGFYQKNMFQQLSLSLSWKGNELQ
ncbi:hypothetical protein GALL_59480 [mine drainage metagenome]|uniref:Type IX secretion system protein PorQ n=1 Tax=mine drainage metagenome TaxID=410659 RepID=A0A1J5SWH0_9ZZZZ